jgi:uncharacterized membrane protein
MSLFQVLLFLHILGAIAGIGPTLVFGRITRLGAEHPEHGSFATRIVHDLTRRIAIPLSALVLVTGFWMTFEAGYDLFATGWLATSIVLFLGAFGYSVLVQKPTVARILGLLDGPGTPGHSRQAELARLRRRARRGGIYLRSSALLIIVLMVLKPF